MGREAVSRGWQVAHEAHDRKVILETALLDDNPKP
jgi:hypothetical protein